MIRQLRFIKLLIKLKLSQMMVFRFNFFGAFFVDSSLFLMQLIAFNAIYSQVGSIGDWSRGQMIIFIGTFSLINALNMVIYFFGIIDLPRKIREGLLDYYITKPVNPLLRISLENVDPGSIPLVGLSIIIILYGVRQLDVAITWGDIGAYSILVLLMNLLWYDMEVILRTLCFFTLSDGSVNQLEGVALEMCMKIPGTLFKGIFKVIFYVFLPYGIMATIPAQVLSRSSTMEGIVFACVIVVVFTIGTLLWWKFGLAHYKSASS